MSNTLLLSNNSNNKIAKYNLENIYKKYLSQTNNEYESLIDSDPKKFYTVIKNSKIYEGFTNTTRYKIFEKVCHMIKSINQNEISLGLDILDIIIPYTDTSLLENTFTFSSINDTTFGLFLYSLEETKEIKIKTLKLITKYHKEIKAQNNFEYLLELINDEENEVRYEAINCLETLIPFVDILPYKTCEIIIFSLKERNNKLRKLFMNLLSKMKLDIDQEKFENILKLIKDNIETFPNDNEKILKLLKNFTRNNIRCLNDEFFIKIFNLEQDFLKIELEGANEDTYYVVKMLVFDIYLIEKNYKIGFKIPKYFIKNLYHYQTLFPDIFEGKLSKQIQDKLIDLKNDNNILIKESSIDINQDKINEIENILINDYKIGIIYGVFYKYIASLLTNNSKLLSRKQINIKIIKKIMTKLRLINIFLTKSLNIEDSNDKNIQNSKELYNLNDLLLTLFDNLLNNNYNDIENKIKKILEYNTNNILESINKEKTPQIGINKLEEYQIYSNIKRGNKFFPFILEFNIIIYNVHNLFEFKKSREKNEIFLRDLFNCFILSKNKNDIQKFEIDLFSSNCTVSSSMEKDYISIKYKGSLFLSSYKNPRDGINEFLFYLEFKDKSQYKQNEIKLINFNIDI